MELENNRVNVLDKGFVRLVGSFGDDSTICQSARVSYGTGTKSLREDRGLIRFLLNHQHGTPLEMVFFRFHVKAPMFVFRQWHRHRVGISINEKSGRYSELQEDCYLPELQRIQAQSKTNKQGSEGQIDPELQSVVQTKMQQEQQDVFSNYNKYLENGISRELARINLPVSTYSEMYWACNLRSLFHFIELRMTNHAQFEIREYAKAMFELIKPLVPLACEAFEDYVLHSVKFSKMEMIVLKNLLQTIEPIISNTTINDNDWDSKREHLEFRKKLGL